MKPLVLSEQNWCKLRYQLQQTHPKSVLMVRWKMKEVLGFTPREYKEWDHYLGFKTSIHLDFFDEPKRTMFLLKYGDWIGQKDADS